MDRKLSDDEIWAMIGYVKSSAKRLQILKTLKSEFLIPSEIAERTGISLSHVSIYLNALKKYDLVTCKNEAAYKGRIYKATELGLEILDIIENNKKE